MNKMNNIIAAIDIGTTKIVAVIGKKEADGKFRVLGIGKAKSSGVKRGNVLNIEETVDGIKTAIKIAELQSNIKIKEVFVGIAGQNIKCIGNSGYINRPNFEQEITQEEIDLLENDQYRIALEPGEEIIHVLPKSFSVDNESGVKPIGICGNRLEGQFHVIIGKSMNIKNLKRCVEKAGIKLISLFLEPIASAKASLTEDEKEAGVAMIDIGGGTSDLAIYYEGSICHTAVVPFGGNVLTNDIKQAYNLLEKDAEELKVKHGAALAETISNEEVVSVPGISGRSAKEISKKDLSRIIQARMDEIIGIIEFQIKNSGYADKLGAGIVLTGGGSLLRALPQFVSFKTGYEIRIGNPILYLNSDIQENVNSPIFSTSVGLIIVGDEFLNKLGKKTETGLFEIQEEEKVVKAISKPDEFGFSDELEKKEAKKKEITKERLTYKEIRESKVNKILSSLSKLFDDSDTKINE